MDGADACVKALLLGGVDNLLRGAVTLGLGNELRELRVFRRRGLRQRMIRRNRHEFYAEQRVPPGRKDLQLGFASRRGRGVQREAYQQAVGAPEPVAPQRE